MEYPLETFAHIVPFACCLFTFVIAPLIVRSSNQRLIAATASSFDACLAYAYPARPCTFWTEWF